MERRRVAGLSSGAASLLVVAAAGAALAGPAELVSSDPSVPVDSLRPLLQAALGVGWVVPGVILARRRPELPFWWLALLAAVSHALAAATVAIRPDGPWALWLASWLVVVELPVLAAIVQLFPTGRTLPRWRPFLIVSVAAGLLGLVAAAVEALPDASGAAVDAAGAASVPLLAFAALGGILPVAVRRRRSVGAERRALGWLLVAMAVGVVVPGLVAAGGRSGEVTAQVFTVAQLTFVTAAVVRHRVWGMVPMTRGSLLRSMAATDGERRRIRAELHDGVGAGVTAIRLKVDAAHELVGSRPDRAAEMLDSASADLEAVLTDVRAMVEGLRPAVLDRVPLAEALRLRADELSAHVEGLTVTVVGAEHLAAVARGADVAAYRVVTEALTNVVRHACARRCEITAHTSGEEVVIDVTDDGGGATAPGDTGGVGLPSMAARAAEVGGYLVAGPDRDRGYRVRLVLPKGPDGEPARP